MNEPLEAQPSPTSVTMANLDHIISVCSVFHLLMIHLETQAQAQSHAARLAAAAHYFIVPFFPPSVVCEQQMVYL